MVVTVLNAVLVVRARIARRIAKGIHWTEVAAHGAYGLGVLFEAHEGITRYTVGAVAVGAVVLIAAIFGQGGE